MKTLFNKIRNLINRKKNLNINTAAAKAYAIINEPLEVIEFDNDHATVNVFENGAIIRTETVYF